MTRWIRLYVTVEGQAEKEFSDQALKPHLAGFAIDVRPRVVVTNRKLGKRGGILDFEKIRGDVGRLMKQDTHPEARFTTMVDLYALPSEFPGWNEARKKTLPLERVKCLSRHWRRSSENRGSSRSSSSMSLKRCSIVIWMNCRAGLPIQHRGSRRCGLKLATLLRKTSTKVRRPHRANESSATSPFTNETKSVWVHPLLSPSACLHFVLNVLTSESG